MKHLKEDIQELANQLFRIAFRRVKNAPDAQDVVQDVLLKLFSDKKGSTNIKNHKAYAIKATMNRSMDVMKRKGRVYDDINGQNQLTDNQTSPLKMMTINESYLIARKAMYELPEIQRKVIELRDMEELSYDEIAATLDLNLSQVKVYLHRGRKQLRSKLNKKVLYEN